jgi:hypothetical protein
MELTHLTFVGPAIDDDRTLARLPPGLAGLLRQLNGFVQFGGGLHVRGACRRPDWHSLRTAWDGDDALHRLYPDVRRTDVPFAEDCLGDQFLLRDGVDRKLAGETGELESLDVDLTGFLEQAQADPVEYLGLGPLTQFQQEGGTLEPGQLLSAFPPYCAEQSADGVSLRAIPALERRRFLADLAAQIRDLPEGATIRFEVTD